MGRKVEGSFPKRGSSFRGSSTRSSGTHQGGGTEGQGAGCLPGAVPAMIQEAGPPPQPLAARRHPDPARAAVEAFGAKDHAEDAFELLMRRASEEHSRKCDELRAENEKLKVRLNTVLQATWSFSEEGWHGKPHDATEASLVLMTEEKQMAWTVPEDFDSPQRAPVATDDEFELRIAWKDTVTAVKTGLGHTAVPWGVENQRGKALETNAVLDSARQGAPATGCIARCMIHPTSNRRIVWDICSVLLLFYDIVMVPIEAFSPMTNTLMVGMDWTTLIFWTFDVFASFATGYSDNGLTRMDPRSVASHYLGSWFLPDMVILVPDWAFTLTGAVTSEQKGSNVTKLLRAFRIVRVLRLLRLAKMKRLFIMLKDNIQSEVVFKMTTIGQFTSILLFGNHFICSAWYLIGDIAKSSGMDNWIEEADIATDRLDFRYATSLQWSLSHFGLSVHAIKPQNTYEQLFSIVLGVLGMVFFWSMTAYITSAMLETRDNQVEVSKQMWLLRRYLRQHETPTFLTYRVLRFAENFLKSQKETIPETKITILPYLSAHLRQELKYTVSYTEINIHPLFEAAYKASRITMHSLVNEALWRSTIAKADVLFKRGTWASHMYWVVGGELFYEKEGFSRRLQSGDWLCEAVLWVPWPTRGTVQADEDSELIVIDAKALGQVIRGDEILHAMMSNYAENFVAWLNNSIVDDLMDIFVGDRSRPFVADFLKERPQITRDQSRNTRRRHEKKQRVSSRNSSKDVHVTNFP